MTEEQKIQISRDLLDPDKSEEAANALVTARFGAEPEKVTRALADVQNTNIRILAKIESDAFVSANPDYVKCQSNFEAITSWMVRYDLAPVRENFQLAYDKLKAAGNVLILSYADVPEEERVAQVVAPVAPTYKRKLLYQYKQFLLYRRRWLYHSSKRFQRVLVLLQALLVKTLTRLLRFSPAGDEVDLRG